MVFLSRHLTSGCCRTVKPPANKRPPLLPAAEPSVIHIKKMEIHLAQNKDIQLLAEMNSQLIKDEGHSNPMSVGELKERMSNWLESEYTAALVKENAQVVGYALWRNENEYLYVRQFFVLPEHRRKGIGKKAI